MKNGTHKNFAFQNRNICEQGAHIVSFFAHHSKWSSFLLLIKNCIIIGALL